MPRKPWEKTRVADAVKNLLGRLPEEQELARRVVEKGQSGLTLLSPAGGLDVAGSVSD